MTSNIGSHIIQDNFDGQEDGNIEEIERKTKLQVFDLLKKSVRPEFLNRIDETIMFHPLTRDNVSKISRIQLELLAKRLLNNGLHISATPEAIEWLAQLGYDPQFGARPIKRVIQKKVMNELSKEILAGNIDSEQPIVIDSFDNKIVFRKG